MKERCKLRTISLKVIHNALGLAFALPPLEYTTADAQSTAQKALRDLKSKISSQSKKNFVLEKDVRYLDSRIALLIQNRMALEEVCIKTRYDACPMNASDAFAAKRSGQPS